MITDDDGGFITGRYGFSICLLLFSLFLSLLFSPPSNRIPRKAQSTCGHLWNSPLRPTPLLEPVPRKKRQGFAATVCGCWSKNSGILKWIILRCLPSWNGDNYPKNGWFIYNGKLYSLMDDLGGKTHLFWGNTHVVVMFKPLPHWILGPVSAALLRLVSTKIHPTPNLDARYSVNGAWSKCCLVNGGAGNDV